MENFGSMKAPLHSDLGRTVASIVASLEAAAATWDEAVRRRCRFAHTPSGPRRLWRCPFRARREPSATPLKEAAREIRRTYDKSTELLGTDFAHGDGERCRSPDDRVAE